MAGPGRGKGHGTGSPIRFKCSACVRRVRANFGDSLRTLGDVELTGRTRPKRGRRYARHGAVMREYRCLCGHVGWSSHRDLERA